MTAFDVSISPSTAAPSSRVRFSGRGFTQPGAVYGHYLYRGRVRKTVRLAKRARGALRHVQGQAPPDPGRRTRASGSGRCRSIRRSKYRRAPERGAIRVIIRVQRVFTRPR